MGKNMRFCFIILFFFAVSGGLSAGHAEFAIHPGEEVEKITFAYSAEKLNIPIAPFPTYGNFYILKLKELKITEKKEPAKKKTRPQVKK